MTTVPASLLSEELPFMLSALVAGRLPSAILLAPCQSTLEGATRLIPSELSQPASFPLARSDAAFRAGMLSVPHRSRQYKNKPRPTSA